MKESHADRIRRELTKAGATKHGLNKPESRELPRIIHEDEHIGGVVYGRIGSINSAMLVATDRRVIFLDKMPLFTTTDEITYDIVSGVQSTKAGPFNSVILNTRIVNYAFRFVNARCADIFIKYIENKRLENSVYDQGSRRSDKESNSDPRISNTTNRDALAFLKKHELGVLSTVDRNGEVHGAVVHYLVDDENFIFILTKSATKKGRNIYAHSQVALTVYETGTLRTLQVQGEAEPETKQDIKDEIYKKIVKIRSYGDEEHLPPVTKLQDGSFLVIKITPTDLKFNDFALLK